MKGMKVIKVNSEYEIQYDTVSDSTETIYQVALVHILSGETEEVIGTDYNEKALNNTIKQLTING